MVGKAKIKKTTLLDACLIETGKPKYFLKISFVINEARNSHGLTSWLNYIDDKKQKGHGKHAYVECV